MHRSTVRFARLLGVTLVAGCMQNQIPHPPSATDAADLAPSLDAHQHLWSRDMATARSDPPRALARLPADLEAFRRARIGAARNKVALAALYTESAWFLESFNPGFIHTPDFIAGWWVGATDSPYELAPIGFGIEGSVAFMTSYLVDSAAKRRDAHMAHSLIRGADGRWRIATETLTMGGPRTIAAIDAEYLVGLLDSAGIRRAVVHSIAYLPGSGRRETPAEQPKVLADNDWTAAQVARFPERLLAFCSVNPIKSYALAEIRRCADAGSFRGLKLHVGNSQVDFSNAQDVARLREAFAAANSRGLAIAIHLATYGVPYGRPAAERFLSEVLPAAPDVPVQIAHLGSPGRLDPTSDSALAVLSKAVASGDPRVRNLWFDVTTVATAAMTTANGKLVAMRIRQVGVGRVLYGSDTPDRTHLAPREGWAMFRRKVPLTGEEFRTIARNVPPYAQ